MEPTMTLVELAAEFRAHGISTSLVTLGDGIEQGVYPFAICIKGKQRTFQISRYRAAEWLRWFTGEGDNPSVSPTASQLPLHKGGLTPPTASRPPPLLGEARGGEGERQEF